MGLILAWAVVTLAMRYAIDPLALQHDQALYLECGRRILADQRPYVDFFDINPPLIMYLNVPAAAASRLLGVHPIPIFTAFVAVLSAAAGAAMLRMARRIDGATPLTWREQLALLAMPLGPCALRASLSGAGQREHLFVLLYLPMFVLRVTGSETAAPPRALVRCAAGLVAGCGIALKPHFALPVIAVEAALVWRARSWRSLLAPELAGAAAFVVLYALGFLLLAADVRHAFFARVVPLVTSGYAAYNPPIRALVRSVARRFALLLLAVAMAALVGERRLTKIFLLPAAAFATGALGAAAAQMKAWSYHFLPVDMIVIFLAALVVAGVGRAVPRLTAAVLAAFLLLWPASSQLATSRHYRMREVVDRFAPPRAPVAFVATELEMPFPAALQTDHPVVTRHLWKGMLALSRYAQAHGAAWAAREEMRFVDETADDLERTQPAAVFVEDQPDCTGCPPGLTMWGWSLRQPRLSAILSRYHFRGVEQSTAIYTR